MKLKEYILVPFTKLLQLFGFVLMFVLLSLTTSCEQNDPEIHNNLVEVVASIDVDQTQISQIGIVGWYGDNISFNCNQVEWWNNSTCTYNGNRWINEPSMYWRNHETNHFLAWYPLDFAKSDGDLSAIKFNLTTASDYDVMWAKSSKVYSGKENNLELNFSHMMSQLEVRLLFKGKYKNASDIVISAKDIFTSATIDLLNHQSPFFTCLYNTDSLELKQKAGNDTIKCHYSTNDIIIPQEISKFHISFKYGNGKNGSFEYCHDSKLQLIPNSLHTLTLEVRNDVVTFKDFAVTAWGNEVIHNCETENDIDDTPYLTFAAEKEQTFNFKLYGSYVLDESIQYSVNNGEWTMIDPSTSISFGADKGTLRLRGVSSTGTSESISKYAQIVFGNSTVPVSCTGDIRTLVDYENCYEADTKNAQFCYLFRGCTNLTSTPELPAEELAERCYFGLFYGCTSITESPELPATVLNGSCYYNMFNGCTALISAPSLPALELAPMCYYYMFNGCSSLISAPELPALILENSCYAYMFQKCTGLVTAPKISATTVAEKCCYNMFRDCSSITEATNLYATTMAKSCYEYMFYGCSALVSAPEMPALSLAERCYYGMYYNCTSLLTAPALNAPTLMDRCYNSMFRGCANLNNITMLATDISAPASLTNWTRGVAVSGTFTKDANMSSLPSGVNGIPENWIVTNLSK